MKSMKLKKKASARTIETYAVCGCVYALCSCAKTSCSCGDKNGLTSSVSNSAISSQMSGNMVNGTV